MRINCMRKDYQFLSLRDEIPSSVGLEIFSNAKKSNCLTKCLGAFKFCHTYIQIYPAFLNESSLGLASLIFASIRYLCTLP